MKTTAKEKIITLFNEFLVNEIIPNKLQIIMEHEQTSEIDFESLKLLDVYFDQAETSSKSDGYNTYNVIVHVFNINSKRVELSIDLYNDFGGLYPLEDYKIFYGNSWGTDLEKYDSVNTFKDLGLHQALNDHAYDEIISDILKHEFENEETENTGNKLQDAMQCFPSLESIEAIDLEECKLNFNTGINITVKISEVESAIHQFQQIRMNANEGGKIND